MVFITLWNDCVDSLRICVIYRLWCYYILPNFVAVTMSDRMWHHNMNKQSSWTWFQTPWRSCQFSERCFQSRAPEKFFVTPANRGLTSFIKQVIVACFTTEVNPRLAKRPLKTNGRLANLELTSLVKEATSCRKSVSKWRLTKPKAGSGVPSSGGSDQMGYVIRDIRWQDGEIL